MQRVPSRQMPPNVQNNVNRANDTSPALLMARRIRDEQGIEQLKLFLAAMEPFVAPYELKNISSGFGIEYDSLMLSRKQNQNAQINQGMQGGNRSNPNQMKLMQMLMNMQGIAKGGKPDMMNLLKMMNMQ